MTHSVLPADALTRKTIDQAVGVLIALRGRGPEAAFAELVDVAHRTGRSLSRVAAGLVALASGSASSDDEAHQFWGELVASRRHETVAAAAE